MRLYKQKRTVDGKVREDRTWTLEFNDHEGRPRRFAAFTDKGASAELGRRIKKLIEFRTTGEKPDSEMLAWLTAMSAKLRQRLAKLDLLDPRFVASCKMLVCPACDSLGQRLDNAEPCKCDGEHLSDFRKAVLNKGGTPDHAKLITARIRNILKGCKCTYHSEIVASRVQQYLADQRAAKDGISAQTSNFYLQAIKQFCRWMVKDRRASESPVEYLDGMNVKDDRRHDRRNLTIAELSKLLTTTDKGPVRHFMTGRARVMLYRVAMETGLRRKELRTLTPGSFQLEGDELTVAVDAGRSKNRKPTLLPIREELATELRKWFQAARFGPSDALWPKLTKNTAMMLKADLEECGIAYVDDAGLFADFHSLRHSFISMLAAGNVHPKLAQRLARHSDINLTMMRYSHTLLADEAQALEALPQFPSAFDGGTNQREALRATGTNDVSAVAPQEQPARACGDRQKSEAGNEAERDPFQVVLGRLGAPSLNIEDGAVTREVEIKTPRISAATAETEAIESGERGIRTPGSPCGLRRFSKPVHSTTLASLQCTTS